MKTTKRDDKPKGWWRPKIEAVAAAFSAEGRKAQAVAGVRRQQAMALAKAESRPVRRARARLERGGRKGRKAKLLVGRRGAAYLNEVADRLEHAARARDSRAGRMPHAVRDAATRLQAKRDRREYRSRAARGGAVDPATA